MAYVVRAINDRKSHCECCGRQGLKKVVWIENLDTNEVKHFGTTCATSPSHAFGLDAEVKEALRKWEQTESERYRRVHRQYRAMGGSYQKHPTKQATWVPISEELFQTCLQVGNEAARDKQK